MGPAGISVAASDNDVKHFYEYFVMMEASHVTLVTLTCFFMTYPSIPDNVPPFELSIFLLAKFRKPRIS